MLDFLLEILVHKIFYKIGFAILYVVTGGRYKGDGGWLVYLVAGVGALLLFAPLIIVVYL
ncbi:hypothetical protein PSCICO_26420 [Pseudomonas cichorii]|uniref:hypothetical protein n=1 Tax=Pseudomonas cichorii TaxID=36746 RepID=UPI0019110D48|nr:hypothetical protein [Pseudomonas cichorii]GFM87243.1 hypothetical protein PSCICO_26420 [Pseudomonas cichorii]